jgi:hypothetical protein
VIHTLLFERIAVVVAPFRLDIEPPEHGARVEVRLLDPDPRRGTRAAAQRVVIDQPVFRADLFDRRDQPPGNMACAHFHPTFEGVEPSPRHWDDALVRNPTGWLVAVLSDLTGVLGRSGLVDPTEPWVQAEADALREGIPEVIHAVESVWRSLGIRCGADSDGESVSHARQRFARIRVDSIAGLLRRR